MPPWIVNALSKLSPEGSAGSFLGSLATLIALVIVKVWQERRKLDKAMQSIPPTVCPMPEPPRDEGKVIATARRIWELEQEVAELRAIKADAVRTAVALAESERRAESLSRELSELRQSVDSGYTRLPLPPSRTRLTAIDVTELDDRQTPREGTKLPR